MGKVVLTYWPLRGLGQHILWILEQGKIEYEFRPMNGQLWGTEKPTLDMDFPNLPYLVDGDIKISESVAICKYLAKKCGLFPSTDAEVISSDIAEGVVQDFKMAFFKLVFNPNYDEEKEKYPEQVKTKLGYFEKALGKRNWLAGERVTWVDLVFYECLDVNSMYLPGLLDSMPNLQAYKSRVEALDGIAAYRASDRFKAYPVTGGHARWGITPSE